MRKVFCFILALTVGMAVKAQTEIGTKEQLIAFATSVNNGTFGDGYVYLKADIDLNNEAWTPIGTSEHPFRGHFEGGDHKISNLTVNTDGLYAGLFGYVDKGAEVKEVHILSGTIAVATDPGVNASYHGGIAGYNLGAINKCSNRALVSGSTYEHARIGGIVGENGTDQGYSGVVRNCYNLGDVYSSLTNVYIGGIVGYNYGSVYNSFMRSDVIKGDPNSSSSHSNYPLYGNNGGTVTGCFYAGGATTDVSAPIVLADDSDNSTTLSGDNLGSGKNVLLNSRTLFTDGDWNTLCLPFSIPATVANYSPIAGATVMEFKSSSFSESTLALNLDYVSSIEAGKPYIVKWNTDENIGNISNPVFMGVTVNNTTSTIKTTNVNFVGSFSPITLEANDKTKLYLGTSNTLYYPSKEKIIKSCRAYFELIDITAGDKVNEARAFVLNFGNGETSGIVDAEANSSLFTLHSSLSEWYTLDGRRLNGKPTKRGIYIHKGKKEVIK